MKIKQGLEFLTARKLKPTTTLFVLRRFTNMITVNLNYLPFSHTHSRRCCGRISSQDPYRQKQNIRFSFRFELVLYAEEGNHETGKTQRKSDQLSRTLPVLKAKLVLIRKGICAEVKRPWQDPYHQQNNHTSWCYHTTRRGFGYYLCWTPKSWFLWNGQLRASVRSVQFAPSTPVNRPTDSKANDYVSLRAARSTMLAVYRSQAENCNYSCETLDIPHKLWGEILQTERKICEDTL